MRSGEIEELRANAGGHQGCIDQQFVPFCIRELRNENEINVNGQIARREVFFLDAWLDDRRS